MRFMTAGSFLRELGREFMKDKLSDIAAMLTYYAVLALFPMIVFVLTMALLVIPESTIQEGVVMLTKTMPRQAAGILSDYARSLQRAAGGGIAIATALFALWAASRATISLGRALNVVFGVRETRPFWRVQLTGVLVTLGVAILVVIALGLLTAGPVLGSFIADRFGMGNAFDALWAIGRWLLAGLIMMLVWSLLYKTMPNTRERLKVFTPGAIAGVGLWVSASLLLALYVQNFGKYEKTYGALGAMIIFLIWLWLSNLALLAGAEIDHVLKVRADAKTVTEREPGEP